MNYEIGQVLYVCNEKRLSIIPVLVVEKIVKKSFKQEETIFKVMFPNKENSVVSIKKVSGKIFESIESIKDHMLKNTTDAIEKIASNALILQRESFDALINLEEKQEIIDNQSNIDVQAETNDDIIMVDLGNGVKAKINPNNLNKVASQ